MATTATRTFELDVHQQPTRGNQETAASPTDHHERSFDFPNHARLAEAPLPHSLVFQGERKAIPAGIELKGSLNIVLIDLENMQAGDLGELASQDLRVYLFLGQTQTRLPLGLVEALQPLGSAVTFIHGKAGGRNSMDSIMAFYLGRLSVELPEASFTVMSKDTGFDPLINYMRDAGVQCRRIADISSKDATARGTPAVPLRVGTVVA